MFDIDTHNKKTTDNNRYLLLRFFLYLMMTLISIEELYTTKNINNDMFFNNVFLFAAPLFIEYKYGIRCYTKRAKKIRAFGYVLSGFVCFICFLGILNIATIEINKNTLYIDGLYLYKGNFNVLFIIRYIHFLMSGLTLTDWVLSYNKEELDYFELYEDVNLYIEDRIKDKNLPELLKKKKEELKEQYRKKFIEELS